MKLILQITIAIASLSMASGCGTIAMRHYPSCQSRHFPCYPACRYDALTIASGGIVERPAADGYIYSIYGWMVLVPFHIIDLPISFVTDTILLPADLIRYDDKTGKDIQLPPSGNPAPQSS